MPVYLFANLERQVEEIALMNLGRDGGSRKIVRRERRRVGLSRLHRPAAAGKLGGRRFHPVRYRGTQLSSRKAPKRA